MIVITADHYPPLGYGHAELVKSEYSSQLGKLPLIFVTTNSKSLEKIDKSKKYCQIDLAPTICNLIDYPVPEEYQGNSMFNPDFPSRAIGVLNKGSVYYQNDSSMFIESLANPATSTKAIVKWVNNLNSFQNQ